MQKSILDFFPNGWTPTKLQRETLVELEHRWNSSKVFVLKLDVASGKCLKKGTKVLMYDGTSRKIEDIFPGEKVMGPDSQPRLVLNTCKGITELYKITPKRGEAYTVTHNHILALKVPKEKQVKGKRTVRQEKIEISVTDFLEKSKTFQKQAKQYQAAVEYPVKTLKVDPYILGVWLGDGNSGGTAITTMDLEIEEEWRQEARRRGLDVRKQEQKGKSDSFFIKSKGQATALNRNTLKYDIGSYGLFWNKHIPYDYLTSSRQQRLELLAGLLDTDGHTDLSKGSITFCLSRQPLLNNIVTLARSLGFSANIGKNKYLNGSEYYRCQISGQNVRDIPVRLRRKVPTNSISDQRNCSFNIIPEGPGEYAGIEVDQDNLYLLDTFVVTHNSAVASCIAEWLASKGGRSAGARICTPTNVLVDQYASILDMPIIKSARNYKCETLQTTCGAVNPKQRCKGCVYNKAFTEAKAAPISISTYHMSKVLYSYRGTMIFDEAHNLSKVIRDMHSKKLFAHRVNMPQECVGDPVLTEKWIRSASTDYMNQTEANLISDYKKDLESDQPLNFYNWSTDFWSNGGIMWGEKLVRSEPVEAPILVQQPLDIFTKPTPFWKDTQKLVLMSATVGRHDLYELGLDRVRPVFIEGDPPISTDRNPIYKDYIGSLSYSNQEKMLPILANKVLDYLNNKKGKGIIHITYGLAKLLKPLLEHDRLITHNSSNMRKKLKEFLASDNKVFLVSGMYEGVSLDYDRADWQVISKIVWPSLTDPLQRYRAKDDPDYYIWSTLKNIIQASGRVCRRPDDYGSTHVLDESFERLLTEGKHLIPKSFRNRIV